MDPAMYECVWLMRVVVCVCVCVCVRACVCVCVCECVCMRGCPGKVGKKDMFSAVIICIVIFKKSSMCVYYYKFKCF